MDGLRKVPENVPNADMLAGHLEKPLTAIPDPFGTHDSFGRIISAIARVSGQLGDYEFMSATHMYQSGAFDATLLAILKVSGRAGHYSADIGRGRRQTYSPFLPLCPQTGRVLMVPVKPLDVSAEPLPTPIPIRAEMTTPVTGRVQIAVESRLGHALDGAGR